MWCHQIFQLTTQIYKHHLYKEIINNILRTVKAIRAKILKQTLEITANLSSTSTLINKKTVKYFFSLKLWKSKEGGIQQFL